MKRFYSLAIAAAISAVALAQGPQGLWMLTDGDNATDALIQGGSVTTYAQEPNADLQYPIAWNATYLGGTFTTIGRDIGGEGGVYDTGHNLVDTFLNFSTVAGQHLDGTLDTLRNISYASNFTTGQVLAYSDEFFNTPSTPIYTVGAGGIDTVTYHASRDSLFVGRGNGTIDEISVAGVLLNSFANPDGRARSLAYDASDDTLWYLTNDGVDMVQIDALGNELSRTTINLGGNYFGGEIAPVPEPATLAVLGLGAAALLRRRKK